VGGGSFGDIYLGVGASGEKVRREVASEWGCSTHPWEREVKEEGAGVDSQGALPALPL